MKETTAIFQEGAVTELLLQAVVVPVVLILQVEVLLVVAIHQAIAGEAVVVVALEEVRREVVAEDKDCIIQ
jgi:hypothetical protein